VDRFCDRFLEYELFQIIDNKYFIKVNFAVWGHHLNQLLKRKTSEPIIVLGYKWVTKNICLTAN